MHDILPFFFEDTQVRVIVRDDVPWWVLNDVCAILAIANPRDAARRLYDWQKDDVGFADAIGRMQQTTIINEPGIYMLVLRSNKPEAERFIYWLTAEMLPQLRRTGSYSIPGAAPVNTGMTDVDTTRFSLALSAVSLMRKMRGNSAALLLWDHLGLPRPDLPGEDATDDLTQRIILWSEGRTGFTNDELAAGLGLGAPDAALRRRFGDILRLLGFELRKVRRGPHLIVSAWLRPQAVLAA